MKQFGVVSYNIYCNFTNYGSALQSWALCRAIDKLSDGSWRSVLVDYCPDVLRDKDPLDPVKNMWDSDEESRRMCMLSMPAIRVNAEKFDRFYRERFRRTKGSYTSENFDRIAEEEIDGFVCGSDTIFCIDEFGGFDDGYYANYPCMKNGYAVSYAASFGDAHFNEETYRLLAEKLNNFKALGLRESTMVPFAREHTRFPVRRVIDPTLLLEPADYEQITAPVQREGKYLLLYTRRYNPRMEAFAEKLAAENGWDIIEISLRAVNAEKRAMRYDAGVEEFLSLVKHAQFVVTNSFHGMIFSVQFRRPFYVFSREQCDTKIAELLSLLGLSDRLLISVAEGAAAEIDYDQVHERIAAEREGSLAFLRDELQNCP